jgi:hypothetical protein
MPLFRAKREAFPLPEKRPWENSLDCRVLKSKNERRRRAGSTRFMGVKPIVHMTHAVLRIRERQNVEHWLLPLPSLRDNGRCRMLGIHIGGVRHPSSEETQLQAESVFVAAYGSNCLSSDCCCWNVRCRNSPAFVALRPFIPLYYSNKAAHQRPDAEKTLRLHHCLGNMRNRQFHIV